MLGLSAFWWGLGLGVAAALCGRGVWAWVRPRLVARVDAWRRTLRARLP